MKKSIFSLIACASMAVMVLFSSCGTSTEKDNSKADANADVVDASWDKVKESGKLILGLDATFKPMGYTDENDEIVGFDIDLAKEVCKRLDIELETYGVNWDTKEVDLDAGTIDCIWNGFTITDERKATMSISAPYMQNKQVKVVKEK